MNDFEFNVYDADVVIELVLHVAGEILQKIRTILKKSERERDKLSSISARYFETWRQMMNL